MSEVTQEEFRRRPGARLLDLLEWRDLDYVEFAFAAKMAGLPKTWRSDRTRAAEHRNRCYVALRAYTHESATMRAPSHEMICRWAHVFGVDPGFFYLRGIEEVKAELDQAKADRHGTRGQTRVRLDEIIARLNFELGFVESYTAGSDA